MKISCDTPFHRPPPLPLLVQCCGNCRYWWGEDDPGKYLNHGDGDDYWSSGAGDINGDCRRYPPTLMPKVRHLDDGSALMDVWSPQTGAFSWCGEYQFRQSSVAAIRLVAA